MVSKIIKIILGFFIIACLYVNLTAYEQKFVRVAVLKDAKTFNLSIAGGFKVFALYTGEELQTSRRLKRSKVAPLSRGLKIGSDVFPIVGVKIIPDKDASIYINKRRFRGEIDIIREKDLQLLVVNRLDVEDYIRGVLYHEISHRWPLEAIKAQAVAARTYAYYQTIVNKEKDYDVTPDIYSQVYGGKTSEKLRTNIAVDRTLGEVLFYKGDILPAFFHATCAGHTEDASNLWKVDLIPLKGVPCEFCRRAPHYRWKRNLRLKDIQDKLNKAGYDIWLIENIEVVERNKSKRIITIKITDRLEKSITISGKDSRLLVGPNTIRSNNYSVVMKGYYVDFLGYGWGHGVGLCQWGAYFMSRKGMKYKEILNYYYPHTKIINEIK